MGATTRGCYVGAEDCADRSRGGRIADDARVAEGGKGGVSGVSGVNDDRQMLDGDLCIWEKARAGYHLPGIFFLRCCV